MNQPKRNNSSKSGSTVQENKGKDFSVLNIKAMPESLSAEAAVLGSMIINPECVSDVIEQINSEAFYRPEHQIIFDALITLYEKNHGQGIDGILLRDELGRRKRLEEIGGVEYIQKIVDSVVSSENVKYYAKIVKEKAMLRELISASTLILDDAYDSGDQLDEALDKAEQKIFAITNKRSTNQVAPLRDLVTQAYELIEKRDGTLVTGMATGYRELDSMTCGLQNGELIIIAGRPSMGKTSFALNIAENIAVKDKKPVAVFSLEMGKYQLAERLLCSNSRIDSQRVRRGLLDESHYAELVKSCSILSESPMFIDDSAGLTPLELRGKARRLKSKHNIAAIFVDYLQLMSAGAGKTESRQQEITTISRHLKALARELNVPVVVLSQLNRAAESREGNRPKMSDLRESGSIEQDADVIMLLHREDYYHKGEENYDINNKAEVIIAKQRNGPTGKVDLMFIENLTRFETIASHIEEI